MDLTQRIRRRAEEFGQEAPALFSMAFAGVQELGLQFRTDLQQYSAPGGTWADFFGEVPLRLLELPVRVLADLGGEDVDRWEQAERALVRAAAVQASLVLLNELVLGAESSYSYEHTLLAPGLHRVANAALGEVAGAPEWAGQVSESWALHSAALLAFRRDRMGAAAPYSRHDVVALGHRWAPATLPGVIAARVAGRGDLVPEFTPLLNAAAGVFQLSRDLANLNRDLSRGHCTYPVARLMEAFGIPFRDSPDPDRVLLAVVLTRTVPELAAEGEQQARALVERARALGLPQLGEGLEPLARAFSEVSEVYSGVGSPEAETGSRPVCFVLSHRPQPAIVRQAARGFLDADPEYRECWEVYRWDFLNVPVLTSRVFPIGLILEQRLAAGDPCAGRVSELLDHYAANLFHYYDEPSPLPPDTDTLGLMLRLAPHAVDPERAHRLLETPLRWALRNERPTGGFPVFMMQGVEPEDGRAYLARVVGQHCSAVQAGFALGLLALPEGAGVAAARRTAEAALLALAEEGAAALSFYDVPFTASLIGELLQALQVAGAEPSAALIDAARTRLFGLLARHAGNARLRPQDAALLQMATRFPAFRELRSPTWMELLVRSQQIDGGWPASPLYVLPHRGNLSSMHSSRLITTALCYRALSST